MITDEQLEHIMRTNSKAVYIAVFKSLVSFFTLGFASGVGATLCTQWLLK